jgi:hypothetical protein
MSEVKNTSNPLVFHEPVMPLARIKRFIDINGLDHMAHDNFGEVINAVDGKQYVAASEAQSKWLTSSWPSLLPDLITYTGITYCYSQK